MNNVQIPRLEALQDLSDHYSSDPYEHSLRVRKRFREQKKLDKAREDADERLKSSYGLPTELALSAESEESKMKAREEWLQARQSLEDRQDAKRRKLVVETTVVPRTLPRGGPSGRGAGSSSDPVGTLRAKILGNTARQGSSLGSLGRMKPPDSKGPRVAIVKRT